MERARSRRTSTRSRKALVLSRFPPNAQPWRDLCSVVAARGAHALRRRDDGVESGEKPTLACGPRPRCAFACAARASVRARRASPRGRRRARGHENAEETGWQNLNSRVSGSRGVPCWRLGGRRGRFCAPHAGFGRQRTARVVGRKFSNRHRSTFLGYFHAWKKKSNRRRLCVFGEDRWRVDVVDIYVAFSRHREEVRDGMRARRA